MESRTNSEVRAFNTRRILNTIYRDGDTTKLELSQKLEISLPTVNTIVKELMDSNLVKYGKTMQSTGGRKATSICSMPDLKLSIGIEVTDRHMKIALVDMTPKPVVQKKYPLSLNTKKEVWEKANEYLLSFIEEYVQDKEKLLGTAIALPLPIKDEKVVHVKNMPEEFWVDTDLLKSCFDVPIEVDSSSKVATFAQIWALNKRDNFQFINVGGYIAGGIVFNGDVIEYKNRHAEYGNITIYHEGKYKRLEEICSTFVLEEKSGLEMKEFMEKVRLGDEKCLAIWNEYLDVFSMHLFNMHCILNWEIVVGGSMSAYIKEFLPDIKKRIAAINMFQTETEVDYISISDLGEFGAAVGAAMTLQDAFLNSIY